jgi:hypothetical protein
MSGWIGLASPALCFSLTLVLILSFVYQKEKPPDLFIWQSWHLTRQYRQAFRVDDIWKAIVDAVGSDAVVEFYKSPLTRDNNKIHEAYREQTWMPKFVPEMPWLDPEPWWVEISLRDFLEFFFKNNPEYLADKEEEKLPEQVDEKKEEIKADVPVHDKTKFPEKPSKHNKKNLQVA